MEPQKTIFYSAMECTPQPDFAYPRAFYETRWIAYPGKGRTKRRQTATFELSEMWSYQNKSKRADFGESRGPHLGTSISPQITLV